MRRPFLLLLLLSLLCGLSSPAQQVPPDRQVTLTLEHVRLDSLVHSIEAHLPLHFYYDETQFDSLDINLSVKNVSLDQLFEKLFAGTPYHYAIDEEGNIFLTKGWMIQTGLAPAAVATLDSTRTTVRFGDEKNARGKGSLENKLYNIGTRTNTLAPGNA